MSTRPRRSATTATPPAPRRGWSWSAWSRTASRSPTRPTRGCSTSSASTPRRRSSSPTSPAAPSDSGGRSGRPSNQRGGGDASPPRTGRGTAQAGAAPGQGCTAGGPPQGAARRGTTPAAAPAAGRVNDEPHALQHEPAAHRADVAEPGYAPASEAGGRKAMRVRPPPSAPKPTIDPKEASAMSRQHRDEERSFRADEQAEARVIPP